MKKKLMEKNLKEIKWKKMKKSVGTFSLTHLFDLESIKISLMR